MREARAGGIDPMEEVGDSMDQAIKWGNLSDKRAEDVCSCTGTQSFDSRYGSLTSLLSGSCTGQMLDGFLLGGDSAVSESEEIKGEIELLTARTLSHRRFPSDVDLNCRISGWSWDFNRSDVMERSEQEEAAADEMVGNVVHNVEILERQKSEQKGIDLNQLPDHFILEGATKSETVLSESSKSVVSVVGCTEDISETDWKRRNTTIQGPHFRETIGGRQTALQKALMKFTDRSTPYVIDPCVGTEFDTKEEAYEYYNLYSWECGFGIRWGTARFSNNKKNRILAEKDRYQLGQEFVCSCSGNAAKNTKKSTTRSNCPAMLRLARTEDHGWVISHHVSEHNHELSATCGEKRQWPSHHHLDMYTIDLIKKLRKNNVGITQLYSILADYFGSIGNVPTTKRCLSTLCHKINQEESKDDINKTLKLIRKIMEIDPGFVYVVQPDEDGRIKTLMWTNSRSRKQYSLFGDAITFDTTYKTNCYDMPFGLFVGVNNHFQSVLLGGVLMTDETIESFQWVFSQFTSLMGGKAPKTILTDQCRAMEVAIAAVWKDTTHRWCKWHVLRKVKECVGPKYHKIKEFRDQFHKMLNEMLTIQEFENGWSQLLDEYGLADNAFLKQIYETREKWVKSYFSGVFCARMSTTQRSESANNMVKTIVKANSSLNIFLDQYMKLQEIRDEAEDEAERKTKLNAIEVRKGGPLAVDAKKLYTENVFKMFSELRDEAEFFKCIELVPEKYYKAEHYNLDRVQRWSIGIYHVSVHESKGQYKCECNLFEHFGLPCSHIIRVLISTGVTKIPECLIVKRWTRFARNVLPEHLSEYREDNPSLLSQTHRHMALMENTLEFMKMGDSNVESFRLAMKIIDDGKDALREISKNKDGLGLAEQTINNIENEQGDLETANRLRAPLKKAQRGRPTNKRDRPGYEKLSRRPRCCRICRSDKHNCSSCPDRDSGAKKQKKAPTCSRCGVSGHNSTMCGKNKAGALVLHEFLM